MEHAPGRLASLIVANSPALCSRGVTVEWRSPLPRENFLEYRDDFLQILGYGQYEDILRRFWPAQGPQWDGLGLLDEDYQLANRLAFLYLLNVLAGVPSYLALVNFVGDTTHIPTDEEAWCDHYMRLFCRMGLKQANRLLDKVVTVFPPAQP